MAHTVSALSSTPLRVLIGIAVLLQLVVLASSSFGLDVIGAGTLSSAQRVGLERVNIVTMVVASLATILAGIRLAVALFGDLRAMGSGG